jgi:hypothetical protein
MAITQHKLLLLLLGRGRLLLRSLATGPGAAPQPAAQARVHGGPAIATISSAYMWVTGCLSCRYFPDNEQLQSHICLRQMTWCCVMQC